MGNLPTKPTPRCPISIRPATLVDLPFIDHWQNKHHDRVGWMPRQQLESKINAGHVLVAEEESSTDCADFTDLKNQSAQSAKSVDQSLLGYVIAQDRYMKRDDLGIIYQLNVLPMKQRNLIGATLVKSVFERAAYGCRLFCCWCAQDIQANYFWESIGFLPLAFRTGANGKKGARTHIFWQRRIREGDATTPYWFPSQTSAGSMREDRLVLPIPPGTHWREVMPVVLPQSKDEGRRMKDERKQKKLPGKSSSSFSPHPSSVVSLGRLRFVQPKVAVEKPKRAPRPKVKNDPKHVAVARELRDRYLEQFNSGRVPAGAQGKYDVRRQLRAEPAEPALLLEQRAA